jgi:hypothetical protein
MKKGNLVNGPITPQDMKSLENSVKQIIKTLDGYNVNLSEDDKQRLPKAGKRITTFVDSGLRYMKSNPEYLSGLMNSNEAQNDRITQKQSIKLIEQVNIVTQLLTDLQIAAGSDAYMQILDYYQIVKREADKGNTSAKRIADDLGGLFKKGPVSDDPEEEEFIARQTFEDPNEDDLPPSYDAE